MASIRRRSVFFYLERLYVYYCYWHRIQIPKTNGFFWHTVFTCKHVSTDMSYTHRFSDLPYMTDPAQPATPEKSKLISFLSTILRFLGLSFFHILLSVFACFSIIHVFTGICLHDSVLQCDVGLYVLHMSN